MKRTMLGFVVAMLIPVAANAEVILNSPYPLALVYNDQGYASFLNYGSTSLRVDGYEIHSAGGYLSASGWTSIDDLADSNPAMVTAALGADALGFWEMGTPRPTFLSEAALFGSATFRPGAPWSIGRAMVPGVPVGDITAYHHILNGGGNKWGVSVRLGDPANGNVPARQTLGAITQPPGSVFKPALDLDATPYAASTTGVVTIDGATADLQTGSPVWLTESVITANATNLVRFSVDFTSGPGAEGLLSIYWADRFIGTIDERTALDGIHQYTFALPDTYGLGLWALGFRLDPFGSQASSVTIDQVSVGYGVPEPATFLTICLALPMLLKRKAKA